MFDEHTFFFMPQNGGISYKVKKAAALHTLSHVCTAAAYNRINADIEVIMTLRNGGYFEIFYYFFHVDYDKTS